MRFLGVLLRVEGGGGYPESLELTEGWCGQVRHQEIAFPLERMGGTLWKK